MKFQGDNSKLFTVKNDSLDISIDNTIDDVDQFVIASSLMKVTGSKDRNSIIVSNDYRTTISYDTMLFSDSFADAGAQAGVNPNKWAITAQSTMAVSQATRQLRLNSGGTTTANTYVALSSKQTFRPMTRAVLEFGSEISLEKDNSTNNNTDFGLFYVNSTGVPTTGVYWRYATGSLIPVINYEGTEVHGPSFAYANIFDRIDSYKHFKIKFTERAARFFVDDNLLYVHNKNQLNWPFDNLPITYRVANLGSTSTPAQVLKVGQAEIVFSNHDTTKPWELQLASIGNGSMQTVTGSNSAATQTTFYANNANPTAAVPTNTLPLSTTAGHGLGGQFWETATVALNTDVIICNFMNHFVAPAQGAITVNKNLYITSISLSSYVQTAITGGPFVEQWFVAYGHTAVSLATTESATAKAPRRIPMGVRALIAATPINTNLGDLILNFEVPIVLYPGEHIALCKKHIGTVATAGTIVHNVTMNGYYE